MVFETILKSDLKKGVQVVPLTGNLFSADNGGNKITVEILDNGSPAEVTGNVTGYVIREDNQTVVIEGSLEENKASIVLPSSAYVVVGKVSIVVKVGTATVGACTAFVYRTTTDTVIDPGTVVPSLAELLQKIADCEAATAEANNVNATMSKTGRVSTITITDRDGVETTTTLTDANIDDTKGVGDTVDAWSADKSATEIIRLDGVKANASNLFNYAEGTPGSVVTVEDAVAEAVKRMKIEIAPIQNLNGYEFPWVGGGGKNLLQNTATTQTIQGVTFTINADGTINTSNTATDTAVLNVGEVSMKGGTSYFIIGLPSNGSNTTFSFQLVNGAVVRNNYYDVNGDTVSVTDDVTYTIRLVIRSGVNANGLVFKPMICLASETDKNFAPYSNICPITGRTGVDVVRTGKNLFNPATATEGKCVTSGGSLTNTSGGAVSDYIPVIPSQTYYLTNVIGNSWRNSGAYYTKDKEYISQIASQTGTIISRAITIPDNCHYIRINYSTETPSVQVELGSSASAYVPFARCDEYPITFPSEAGTVYGGEIALNDDGSGVLTVDKASVDMGNLEWAWSSNGYFQISKDAVNTLTGFNPARSASAYMLCSHWKWSGVSQNAIYATANAFRVVTNLYPDASSFISAMTGATLVYELATPITYPLTAQQVQLLLGLNNVWSPDGNITEFIYPIEKTYDKSTADLKFAGAIEQSITTPVAVQSFTDGAKDIPMELTVGIEPVQDLHGQTSPWVGGAGKNLFPEQNVSGTLVSSFSFALPAGTYVVSALPTSSDTDDTQCAVNILHNNTSLAIGYLNRGTRNSATLTISSESNTINFYAAKTYAKSTGDTFSFMDVMICLSTATDPTVYAPYENICPISGWTGANIKTWKGKNLFNKELPLEYGSYINDSGSLTDNTYYGHSEYYTEVKPNTHYVFSGGIVAGSIRNAVAFYDSNKTFISRYLPTDGGVPASFDTPSNCKYIRFNTASASYINLDNIQLEEGTVATTYEPYAESHQITFPDPPGTVYGGTLKVNKDGTGVLTDLYFEYIFDNNRTYVPEQSIAGYWYIKSAIGGFKSNTLDAYCNGYLPSYSATPNVFRLVTGAVFLYDNRFTSSEAVSQILSAQPIQVVGRRSADVTYTLTAEQVGKIMSLKGVNNVWCDTGNVLNIEYSADTKIYIDQLFATIINGTGVSF